PPALHGAPVGHHVRLPGVPARPRRRGAPRDGALPPPARGLAPGCRGPRLSASPAWLARAVRAPMDAATMSRVITRLRAVQPSWNTTALAAVAHTTARDPFRILVSCLLSLRTRDETTGPAAARLFALADTPAAMLGSRAVESSERSSRSASTAPRRASCSACHASSSSALAAA